MPLAPIGGQPLSNPYPPVIRTGDADNVLLRTLQVTVADAENGDAARVYTLPPLSNVGPGAWCLVLNVGDAGNIDVSPDGTELMNDGEGAQTISMSTGVSALFVAKVAEGATPGSWFRLVA